MALTISFILYPLYDCHPVFARVNLIFWFIPFIPFLTLHSTSSPSSHENRERYDKNSLQPVLPRVVQREILEFALLCNYWRFLLVLCNSLTCLCPVHYTRGLFLELPFKILWFCQLKVPYKCCVSGDPYRVIQNLTLTRFWPFFDHLTPALKFETLNVKKLTVFGNTFQTTPTLALMFVTLNVKEIDIFWGLPTHPANLVKTVFEWPHTTEIEFERTNSYPNY